MPIGAFHIARMVKSPARIAQALVQAAGPNARMKVALEDPGATGAADELTRALRDSLALAKLRIFSLQPVGQLPQPRHSFLGIQPVSSPLPLLYPAAAAITPITSKTNTPTPVAIKALVTKLIPGLAFTDLTSVNATFSLEIFPDLAI
jgi:hypothetical protein